MTADLPAEDVWALAEAMSCKARCYRATRDGCVHSLACIATRIARAEALAPTVALIRDRHAAAFEARLAAVEAVMDVAQDEGWFNPYPELRAALHSDPPNSPRDTPQAARGAAEGAGEGSGERMVDRRDPECVKNWPECSSMDYDPRCCRFPKSCSAGTFEWVTEP